MIATSIDPVAAIVQRLHAKRSGSGWLAKCPAHDDRKPSLSISEGSDEMPPETTSERLAPRFRLAQKCCETRQVVFDGPTQNFPWSVKPAHALKIREPHVITVTGKAF